MTLPTSSAAFDPQPHVATLANGVRVLSVVLPHLASAGVSVFVRSGSAHEPRRFNGIGHVVEHMVFKGTEGRDRRRINLEAERLGAEVNAHTDKDHTAFHLRGLAEDAVGFVHMLADLVQHATFPEHELASERQVLLSELDEDEDDPMSTAFKLFDKACYGLHPVSQAVIGTRRNIERFSRDDLAGWVRQQYTGANVIVAAAGPIDTDAIVAAAEAAFGAMPRGDENRVEAAPWIGGLASRHLDGTTQAHAVLGGPIPALHEEDAASVVAAAVLGEGMSSPLMERLREERGLVYYAACSADVYALCGQFVIEASMAPDRLDECLSESMRLLALQAERVDAVDLERAQRQILVRRLRDQEHPVRLLEDAALDLFALGRVRSRAERMQRIQAVGAGDVRDAFQRLLGAGLSVAVTGQVGRGVRDRLRDIVATARR
ncbi:pitrilysin family protein [Ideonella sp. A 288]|uniref:M16 family metallopeptidase n=1 Tax=Ideonella sp. A 288 TaxID=1962181 RepID=UPI000B4AAEC6|nr:pitrilysin family protein [Ideonella sp. A 288]